mgnify:CR=1 FL=1
MKPQIHSPSNLATILEVDSNSSSDDKGKEGWIMSVSKTFCAATAALMAADGEFGEKKMDATLLDILEVAEARHLGNPERMKKIQEYREMIKSKGCGDVTMSQLLSHRSGLTQGDKYFNPGNITQIELYSNPDLLAFDSNKQGKVFSYCNSGFTLAEDMMSLVSDSEEGYYRELKDKIVNPLGLTHTKSVYESEESRATAGEIVTVEGVVYDWGVASKETVRTDPLKNTQKGYIALSEGGLCSSVSDLEEFYAELSKLACGMPNRFVSDSTKTQEIHGFYLDAYNAGEHCKSDSDRELSIHCAAHYSLGVIIEAVDESDKIIPSRGNEDKARIRLHHIGNHPGNDAAVSATMPFSFSTFTQSKGAGLAEVEPELRASISQKDVLAKDSLLTIVSCDYIAKMDEYFCSRCDKATDKKYNDEWRAYNQYWEAARTGDYVGKSWQADLISQHRLPKNFSEYHDEICAAYAPAQEALIAYVKENFCDEHGVIDSRKVKSELQTAEDFEKVRMAIRPSLEKAQQDAQNIFARCDAQLLEEKKKYDQNLVKFDSWVEKLGLEKSSQQETSFVERMRSDKTQGASKDGFREL